MLTSRPQFGKMHAMQITRDDVIAAIHAFFPGSDAATILGILDFYGTEPHERERERVQLAIVSLSEGNEDKLPYFVQTAKTDYRDVLHWAASGPLSPEQGEEQRQAALGLIKLWNEK
jgi:hypothetical protein